jgi:NAD(P)-dependent dehydrogenase (short-subunit alcohol dehydrogenase family)
MDTSGQGASTRVAVVTGGGRGIGRGIVRALAAKGWSVVINYRSDDRAAAETADEASRAGAPRTLLHAADVADAEAASGLVMATLESFGRIDLWVNNAGVAPAERRDLLDMTPESWDRVLGTNLRGPFFLTQTVARAMLTLVENGTVEHPQIVFVTSVSAELASVNRGEYCVSKAGLSMVARLFASRLAASGVRVYEVRPGIIATDMTAGVQAAYRERIENGLTPIARIGTPDDVGAAVAALAEGALPYATGSVLNVDGGLTLPRL